MHVRNRYLWVVPNWNLIIFVFTIYAVWNTHARIEKATAEAFIMSWASLTPAVTIESPCITPQSAPTATDARVDLDTPDELAIRSLLLGIVHRTAGYYVPARAFLKDAYQRQAEIENSIWVGGVALFESAVLDLKEAEVSITADAKTTWAAAIKNALEKLDKAFTLATSSNTDLSSRLDTRIAMLRDEIAMKKEMLGLV